MNKTILCSNIVTKIKKLSFNNKVDLTFNEKVFH